LYRTMQLVLSNVTVHPASVRTRIPNSEAIDRSGIMCPVSTVGSPSILMSHMCVDQTIRPSANATFSGCVVGRLLTTGVPSITKIWVAPESAMASYVFRRNPANPAFSICTRWLSACALNDCCEHLLDDTLEMITVASSSISSTIADEHTLMGYDECCCT
jgi:hypothetical protein